MLHLIPPVPIVAKRESGTPYVEPSSALRRRSETNPRHIVRRILLLAATTLFGSLMPNRALAELDNCADPAPLPGPARPWEAGIGVSPYCEVNTRHRNLFTAIPIVGWSGTGPDMGMAFYHNAATVGYPSTWNDNVGFDLGPGWTIAYSDQLILNDLPDTVKVVHDDGTEDLFTWNETTDKWDPPAGVHDRLELVDAQSSTWRLTHKNQSFHEFHALPSLDFARLTRMVDAVGAVAAVSYSEETGGRITSISAAGRVLNFVYCNGGGPPDDCVEVGPLWKIEDPGDDSGCSGVTCMPDRFWELEFESGRLSRIILPNIDPPNGTSYTVDFIYTSAGRIEAIEDVDEEFYEFAYSSADGGIEEVEEPNVFLDPNDGRSVRFNTICGNHAYRTDYTDRYGKVWKYSYNTDSSYDMYPDGNLNMMLKPGPGSSLNKDMLWDEYRNLVQFVDEVGAGYNAGFDDRGNRTFREDGLSRLQEWEYDEFNNMTAYIDADENRVEFEYAFAADPIGGECSSDSINAGARCVTCSGGTNDGDSCYYESDCPGGTCELDDSLCHLCDAGSNIGQPCTLQVHCPGGECVGTCESATPPPPPYPTLLTKIIQPAISVSGIPPLDEAETLVEYYLESGELIGQIKQITDPNGVVTNFEYDQWGQLYVYAEGEYGGYHVYCERTKFDGGGRLRTSETICPLAGRQATGNGHGGNTGYNPLNHAESSTCFDIPAFRDPSVPFQPAGFPLIPGNGPTPPIPYTQFAGAEYTPYGASTNLATDVHAFAASNPKDRIYETTYDALRRVKTTEVETGEAKSTNLTRGFAYAYELVDLDASPTAEDIELRVHRTGPDDVETVTHYDDSGRAAFFRRGPARSGSTVPLLEATYEYYDNDLVHRVFYGDPAAPTSFTEYTYDLDNEVETIEFKKGTNTLVMKLVYEWDPRGMPEEIREYKTGPTLVATINFTYDQRGRLVKEIRDDSTDTKDYNFTYEYDQGGNRTFKVDTKSSPNRRYQYFYDLADPSAYESKNNRLEYVETLNNTNSDLISTTWYYYNDAGNVRYIVTPGVSSGSTFLMGGGEGGGEESFSSEEESSEETESEEFESEGGGGSMLMGMGGECDEPLDCGEDEGYTGIRFEYARNNQTLAYVIGEEWCTDGETVTTAKVSFALEFRYDSGRQRYLSRKLTYPENTGCYSDEFIEESATWTDYDGDAAYGDWSINSSGVIGKLRAFEPGIGRVQPWAIDGNTNSNYFRADMLGTTRLMTKNNGDPASGWGSASAPSPSIFTAFGERLSTSGGILNGHKDRYGYIGAHGYQAHDEMAFLHVGSRYYDPNSGRFLFRDRVGIRGGANTYSYARAIPTTRIDPEGFFSVYSGTTITGGLYRLNPQECPWATPGGKSYCKQKSLHGFHKGADSCHREVNPGGGRGCKQCCYDKNGNLIPDGAPGHGTKDVIGPATQRNSDGTCGHGFFESIGHFMHDVIPALW